MDFRRKDFLIYLGFFLLTLLFFFKFLTGEYIFAYKDLSRYFYPLRMLMVEQVKAGILPLWNPYIYCGNPLIATLQTCFFYPLTVIYYLIPYNLAFNYYIIIHYFLAAVFTYLLMRDYALSRASSIFSAIVFAFSGYLLSVSIMNTTLTSVIWLPLVILFTDRLVKNDKKKISTSAFLGVVLTLMFLGGEPTAVYITALLMTAYVIIFSRSARLFNVSGVLLALLLVFLLSAVQLFPFLEYAKLSDRANPVNYQSRLSASFPLRETLNIILPFFWGNVLDPDHFMPNLLEEKCQQWIISPYMGILPILLALFALFKPDKKTLFWTGAALCGLFLSFGGSNPLYLLFYKFLPGFGLIRHPIKFLFLFTFAVAVLSGFGFERFCDKIKFSAIAFLSAILAISSGIYFYLIARSASYYSYIASSFPVSQADTILNIFDRGRQSLGSLILLVIVLFGVVALCYFGIVKSAFLKPVLLAVMVFDLLSANAAINLPVSSSAMNIREMNSDKDLFRIYKTPRLNEETFWINNSERYETAIMKAKNKLANNLNMLSRQYDIGGYESVVPVSHYRLIEALSSLNEEDKAKMLGALNVKYIADSGGGGEARLFSNKYLRPRAYLVKDLAYFAPAEIIEYLPDRVKIKTDSKENACLFLSDSYYPGWKAFVDGRETNIYKTNYKFRAVPLKKGRHLTVFSYDPLSFKLGAAVSILALLGLSVLIRYNP